MVTFLRAVATIGMILGGGVFICGIAFAILVTQQIRANGGGPGGILISLGIASAAMGLVVFLISSIILMLVLPPRGNRLRRMKSISGLMRILCIFIGGNGIVNLVLYLSQFPPRLHVTLLSVVISLSLSIAYLYIGVFLREHPDRVSKIAWAVIVVQVAKYMFFYVKAGWGGADYLLSELGLTIISTIYPLIQSLLPVGVIYLCQDRKVGGGRE